VDTPGAQHTFVRKIQEQDRCKPLDRQVLNLRYLEFLEAELGESVLGEESLGTLLEERLLLEEGLCKRRDISGSG
jgi:hypothetical protein